MSDLERNQKEKKLHEDKEVRESELTDLSGGQKWNSIWIPVR